MAAERRVTVRVDIVAGGNTLAPALDASRRAAEQLQRQAARPVALAAIRPAPPPPQGLSRPPAPAGPVPVERRPAPPPSSAALAAAVLAGRPAAPVVNVAAPRVPPVTITVPAPRVEVERPAVPAVRVPAPRVTVQAADRLATVTQRRAERVAAPRVEVERLKPVRLPAPAVTVERPRGVRLPAPAVEGERPRAASFRRPQESAPASRPTPAAIGRAAPFRRTVELIPTVDVRRAAPPRPQPPPPLQPFRRPRPDAPSSLPTPDAIGRGRAFRGVVAQPMQVMAGVDTFQQPRRPRLPVRTDPDFVGQQRRAGTFRQPARPVAPPAPRPPQPAPPARVVPPDTAPANRNLRGVGDGADDASKRLNRMAEGVEKVNGVLLRLSAVSGGIVAAGLAAMPQVAEHTTNSFKLLAGEIGISMIPEFVRVAGAAQDLARWYKGLGDGTKAVIGSTLFYGSVLGAGVVIIGQAVRGVLALVQGYNALTGAAGRAAAAQQASNAAGATTAGVGVSAARGITAASTTTLTNTLAAGAGTATAGVGAGAAALRGTAAAGRAAASAVPAGVIPGSAAVGSAGLLARAGVWAGRAGSMAGTAARFAGSVAIPVAAVTAAIEQGSSYWEGQSEAWRDSGGWSAEARRAGRNPLYHAMQGVNRIPGLGSITAPILDQTVRPIANRALGMNMPQLSTNDRSGWIGGAANWAYRNLSLPGIATQGLESRGVIRPDRPPATAAAAARPGQELMTSYNSQFFSSAADMRDSIIQQSMQRPSAQQEQEGREMGALITALNNNTIALGGNTVATTQNTGDSTPGPPSL